MSKITFESIRQEKNIDELFRIKHELVTRASTLHQELHNGNTHREKSDILGDINETRDLEEYVFERIKVQRHENFIADKEKRFGLSKFKELAKAELPEAVWKRLDQESRKK